MKRIFFVEDDLSLINGLSFAMKKQDMRWMFPEQAWKQSSCGWTENMIWSF